MYFWTFAKTDPKVPMSDRPLTLYSEHGRTYRENKFVYPVLSRRSGGISIGVNLNPDKVCNFDCIYCQVDRRSEAETQFVETDRLLAELDAMFQFVSSGAIYQDSKFADVPAALRRLNDVAFSGDGEPTTYKNFDEIIAAAAGLKDRHGLAEVKMVLITNATMFHRPAVDARVGDPGCAQRRDLGQARIGHGRVLPIGRADQDPVSARARQYCERQRNGRSSSKVCSCGSTAIHRRLRKSRRSAIV